MHWEQERYVRLYTRDTATWKLLPWESRALLMFILRKLDPSGITELGEEWTEALAALVDAPVELVDAGMPELLRRGVFVFRNGGTLVMPNYIPAQEAKMNGRLRSELHRERVRIRDATLSNTTEHGETPRNTVQHDGTPSLAKPSLAYGEEANASTKPSRAKKATQCPPNSAPVEVLNAWLAEWEIPAGDPETIRLLDYARSNGKAYKDWSATWRNWIKRAEEWGRRKPSDQTQRYTEAEIRAALEDC